MSECTRVLKEVARWLREGRPDADNLVDFPWEVEAFEKNVIKAVHPRFPIEINISCSEDTKSLRAIIFTNIATVEMDNRDRVRIYRKLLRLNRIPVAKTLLYGDEDYIGVASDISIYGLGKKEFNDALAFLIALLLSVVKEVGFEEELYSKLVEELARLVSKHFEEGWSREKLVKYLVEIVGLTPSDAEEFLLTLGIRARDLITRIRDSLSM